MSIGRFPAVPPPSELAWYVFLRLLERWAARLSEEEMIRRVTRLTAHLAGVAGRPAQPFMAMGRGLAQTIYFRTHKISILDRLDPPSLSRWATFRADASRSPRAIFVSAHLGPFQLQMDILAGLPHEILFLYRSYSWPPLVARMDSLRLRHGRFKYADMRRPRQVIEAMNNGISLAFLGDVIPMALPAQTGSSAKKTSNLFLYGRPILDDFPVRMAGRAHLPIFVGGIYNHESTSDREFSRTFGFDFSKVDPGTPDSANLAYSAAMERAIRNNPADWVRFE